MSLYKFSFALLIFLTAFGANFSLWLNTAFAANPISEVEVVKFPCRLYLQEQGKMSRISPSLFLKGSKLKGSRHSKDPRFFIVQQNGKSYFIDSACVQESSTAVLSAPLALKRGSWQARASIISYKTQIQILDPLQGSFTAYTQAHALCVGAGYQYPLTSQLQFHGEGCFFFGKADASGAENNSSFTQNYKNDNVGIFGLRSTVGVQLKTPGDGVLVGLAIPLLFESVHWDNAGGTVSVDSSAVHLLGLLLTLEANRGKYGLITEFGFLQKIRQSMWNLGITYQL